MLSRLAHNVASFFVQKGLIKKEDREIYVYGFEVLISEAINWLICITIAIATGKILETIFYMIAFMHLRETLGGFHAKSHYGCIIISTLVYAACLWLICMTPAEWYVILAVVGLLIYLLQVYLVAPVAHPNKPFTSGNEIRVFRKRSIRNSLIYCGVCVILMILPWEVSRLLSYCVLLGMLTASISMMVEYAIQIMSKRKEEK
ncbi:MAG: accessory gene regulator B family protein [Clostridia bacterium]|nr:accessory gene regulator B family protein [Clostridia bacterium]